VNTFYRSLTNKIGSMREDAQLIVVHELPHDSVTLREQDVQGALSVRANAVKSFPSISKRKVGNVLQRLRFHPGDPSWPKIPLLLLRTEGRECRSRTIVVLRHVYDKARSIGYSGGNGRNRYWLSD